MSAAGWRAGVAAALLAALLPARPAVAQTAPRPADAVDVTLIGAGPDADELLDSLRELIGRLGLTLTPHLAKSAGEVAPAPSARVIVEVDFTPPGEIAMSVRSEANRAPARRRIAHDGPAAVVREEVADAVSSMVESQLVLDEAHDAGVASPAPPAPEPPPAPPPALIERTPEGPPAPPAPARAHWFAIDLTTFAGVGPFAGSLGLVGRLGGGVIIASRRGLRPSLTVTGAGLLPFETASADGVSVHTSIAAFRAIAAIEVLRSYSWFALDVGAGVGFDVLSVTPFSPPASAEIDSTTRTDAIVCVEVAANLALSPEVMLTLTAIGDGDLRSRRYQVVTEPGFAGPATGTTDTLLAPWIVRPTIFAGFTFTTFGDGRFASRDPR